MPGSRAERSKKSGKLAAQMKEGGVKRHVNPDQGIGVGAGHAVGSAAYRRLQTSSTSSRHKAGKKSGGRKPKFGL